MNSAAAPSLVGQDLEQLCVNTIRTLSIDGVQAANSGHPGTPMAMVVRSLDLLDEDAFDRLLRRAGIPQ